MGLGVGIPVLLIFMYVGYVKCCKNRKPIIPISVEPIEPNVREMDIDISEQVRSVLTPIAFKDFISGTLSERLKYEIMIYRVRQKRDLTEFIKFSKQRKNPQIALWIENLNPTNIPEDIRREAYQQQGRINFDRDNDSDILNPNPNPNPNTIVSVLPTAPKFKTSMGERC